MIIYNGSAFIQALLGVFLLIGIHYFCSFVGIDFDLSETNNLPDLFLIFTLFATFTDARGLKGKVFFLPTWIVSLLITVLVFITFSQGSDEANLTTVQYSVYITLFIAIPFIHGRVTGNVLRKSWEEKQAYLAQLKAKFDANEIEPAAFWLMASHVFHNPSLFFLKAYPVWKVIHWNPIDSRDFISFYQDFINMMNFDEIDSKFVKGKVLALSDALNNATSLSDYSHPSNAFAKLAQAIDIMNDKYGNGPDKGGKTTFKGLVQEKNTKNTAST